MSQVCFIWSNILHVSDRLSVHHQEFETVHTEKGICQTDTADCLLASTFTSKSIAKEINGEVEKTGFYSNIGAQTLLRVFALGKPERVLKSA